MIVANYYIQHVLKTYSQQLSVRCRVSKGKVNSNNGQRDEVTHEIINQMASGSERNMNSQEILKRLSKEFGRPLDVEDQNGSGMTFKVLNEKGLGVVEYLSSRSTAT